jgi:hypothetical protein
MNKGMPNLSTLAGYTTTERNYKGGDIVEKQPDRLRSDGYPFRGVTRYSE